MSASASSESAAYWEYGKLFRTHSKKRVASRKFWLFLSSRPFWYARRALVAASPVTGLVMSMASLFPAQAARRRATRKPGIFEVFIISSEALDLEVIVRGRRAGGGLRGRRRGRLGARLRRGPARGGRGLRGRARSRRGLGLLRPAGLLGLVLAALEAVPGRIAGGADARDAQREVVGIAALPQRLFVGDDLLLEEAHQGLVEGLHPVGGVALGDGLRDLLGAILVLDHLAHAAVADQHHTRRAAA